MIDVFPGNIAEPGDYSGFSDSAVIAEFNEVAALMSESSEEAALIERWYAVTAEVEYRGLDIKKG